MANIIKRETSIDAETGEIYYQKEWASFNGWSADGYKYRYRYNAIKLYPDFFPDIMDSNIFKIFIMLCYRMNEDNLFVNRVRARSKYESPDVEPLSVDEIWHSLPYKMSKDTFYKAWRFLKPKYVRKIRVGNKFIWSVNPAYANRTHTLPLFLFKPYREDLKEKLGKQNYQRYLNMELNEDIEEEGIIEKVWRNRE